MFLAHAPSDPPAEAGCFNRQECRKRRKVRRRRAESEERDAGRHVIAGNQLWPSLYIPWRVLWHWPATESG